MEDRLTHHHADRIVVHAIHYEWCRAVVRSMRDTARFDTAARFAEQPEWARLARDAHARELAGVAR